MNKNRLYQCWSNMKSRCFNIKNPSWEYYGGKGVTVCQEWHSFEVFRDWALSNGYADNLTIDRIDSDGNYKPSNCQWVTRAENNHRTANEPTKKIMCVETGQVFEWIADAAKSVGLKGTSSINEALKRRTVKGKAKTAGGYTWVYV